MVRRHRISAAVIAGGIVVAIAVVFTRRGPSDVQRPPTRVTPPSAAARAAAWLAAVAGNRGPEAVALAAQLVATADLPAPDKLYIAIAANENVARDFLVAGFNEWDYRAWREAYEFAAIACRPAAGGETLPRLFEAVRRRIAPREDGDQPDWPAAVWARGYGLCDRQAWVLAELAYQAGWEAQVVYLGAPHGNDSPHTICELRRGRDVWFADPLTGILLQASVDDVAADQEYLRHVWPDRERWQEAVRYSTMWTPAAATDYCPRNQRLNAVLRKYLGSRTPRFGADPRRRLEAYRRLRQGTLGNKLHFRMGLWFFPFRILAVKFYARRGKLRTGEPVAPAGNE